MKRLIMVSLIVMCLCGCQEEGIYTEWVSIDDTSCLTMPDLELTIEEIPTGIRVAGNDFCMKYKIVENVKKWGCITKYIGDGNFEIDMSKQRKKFMFYNHTSISYTDLLTAMMITTPKSYYNSWETTQYAR